MNLCTRLAPFHTLLTWMISDDGTKICMGRCDHSTKFCMVRILRRSCVLCASASVLLLVRKSLLRGVRLDGGYCPCHRHRAWIGDASATASATASTTPTAPTTATAPTIANSTRRMGRVVAIRPPCLGVLSQQLGAAGDSGDAQGLPEA